MTMVNLDRLDRRVLFELDRDARQSLSDIARLIGEGRDRVEYRVQRLCEEGVIQGFTTSVDLFKLGYMLIKTYLRLENNRARVAEFMAHLRKHPQVYWLAYGDGVWDIVIAVSVRHIREFHDFHNKLLSEFNSVILQFNTSSLVDLKFYSRNYLLKNSKVVIREWGKPDNVPVDTLDLKIIKILAKDSRTSIVGISDRVGSAPHVVRYRIERLEKLRVITSYHTILDLTKLDMLFIKCQLTLRNYELSQRELLVAYCKANPFIVTYIEQVGDCNIELEFEVPNYQKYCEIIDDIRGQYSKLIRNFQSMLIRKSDFESLPVRTVEGS